MLNIFKCLENLNKTKEVHGNIEHIVVGLGNPGDRYSNTRHNIGFMAMDSFASKNGLKCNTSKFDSKCVSTSIDNKKILILKPQTYMNSSGVAVEQALSFYKLTPDKLTVVYDDVNLDVSKIRIRTKGSAGGHNGVQNIIDFIGSENFPRIRIGVGKKPNPSWDLKDWVLSRFTSDEMVEIDKSIEMTYLALELIISGKIEQAMNKYN